MRDTLKVSRPPGSRIGKPIGPGESARFGGAYGSKHGDAVAQLPASRLDHHQVETAPHAGPAPGSPQDGDAFVLSAGVRIRLDGIRIVCGIAGLHAAHEIAGRIAQSPVPEGIGLVQKAEGAVRPVKIPLVSVPSRRPSAS